MSNALEQPAGSPVGTSPPLAPPPAPGGERASDSRLGELWRARQLLGNLTVRELKVRYKRSAIGFLWSLLNPLLTLAVYSLVFGKLFDAGMPQFPLYFITGYLAWSFFQGTLQSATGSIVGNANLVKKVYFPREVLPVATMLAQLVHFLLAELVLFVVLAATGHNFLPYLPIFALATVLMVVLATGVAMLFAALNTAFRDLQEISGVLFMVWFFATPIVYSVEQVPARWRWLLDLNPMTHVIRMFRNALYPEPAHGGFGVPSASTMLAAAGFAVVALAVGYVVFGRMAADFAKEI